MSVDSIKVVSNDITMSSSTEQLLDDLSNLGVEYEIEDRIHVTFERTKEGVEFPKYAHEGDACMDLRVYPDQAIVIGPNQHHVFDTYLKFDIPKGHVMKVHPRSGLGIKHGIILRNIVGVIDSNFTETVKVCLANNSTEEFVVSPGDRVAQFQIVPYPKMIMHEGKVGDSGRGEGIGSSGVK